MLDVTDFTNDANATILVRVPVESRADLVRVLKRAKYTRCPCIEFALMWNDEITSRCLKALVEERGFRQRSISPEAAEPAEEILAVDGQTLVFEAGVKRPHGVV